MIQREKMNYLPLIILPMILFICFGLWFVNVDTIPTEHVDFNEGIYDMRQIDFSKTYGGIHKDVEYIPGVLLSPEEFNQRDDTLFGNIPDGTRVCTARIRVLVPENKYYGILGYSMNYASRVYINGNWVFDEGKPGLTLAEERSSESYRLFSAVPQDGVIEILVQTSAFSNIDNTSGMEWSFGEYEPIRISFIRQIATHIIVMAWYLIAAVVSLLLFLALPKYQANGWLALLGVLWSLRAGLKSVKILLTLFPYFEWPVIYKAEILTCPLTIILFVLILHSSFPQAFPKWLRFGLIGAAGTFIVVIFILPWYRFFGHSSITNMVIYLTLAILLPFIVFSVWKKKATLPQIIILIGVGLSIFAFAWDADYFAHGAAPFAISQPMMLSFILFMTASALLATMEQTVAQEVLLTQTVEQQKNELSDARISIMLGQIQPHFLYNSLSAISRLCTGNPDAKKALITFSEYLRGNMDSLAQKDLILFEKELEHTQQYLELEGLRFEERLQVVYDIPMKDFMLPTLTLQPIVENAVRYGVLKKHSGGIVTIRTEETEKNILITVIDDGVGFDPNAPMSCDRSHTGISNVRERLAAMCGGTLTITSVPGEGTTALIVIPRGGDEHEYSSSRR